MSGLLKSSANGLIAVLIAFAYNRRFTVRANPKTCLDFKFYSVLTLLYKEYPNEAQLGVLYMYDISLCLGFIHSLAVIVDPLKAEMLNVSILFPISAFSALERLSVLLLGNGLLKFVYFSL